MQEFIVKCDNIVAEHLYAILSNTKGVYIQADQKSKNKPKESLEFLKFAGMWKDKNVTLNSIREKAWQR